ncbi:MAG: hydrogenase maturation protease [Muricauda sp.]|jgi:hydrogenase maturation protease|nr:hydrogenase maturation protease [Allomuricauda sp.]MBO6830925.1 hydrogenase maturation protease [Allomuricauda sp.]
MKTAIMGFGNPVRSDDAVGIYVIEQLRKKLPDTEDIRIFDMGTAAFEVLFGLKGHDKIILVDAVLNSKEPVGTLFKVPAEEVMKAPQEDPMVFLHGMKWDQALSYTKKIMQDEYPEDIQVYLVAIENTKLEVDLSNAVKDAGDKIVQHILEDLNLSIPT